MQAAPQGLNPASQTHWRDVQDAFGGQALPQLPQLPLLMSRFRHVPPQQVSWPGHPACSSVQQPLAAMQPHWPPLQPAFCGQVAPHDPQFCASVFVFRQVWLQHVCWDEHPA